METLKVTYSHEADAMIITDTVMQPEDKKIQDVQSVGNFLISFNKKNEIVDIEIIQASKVIKQLQNILN